MLNIQASGKLYDKQITVKQISKPAAAKLFKEGKEVYLQSSNMRPFNIWQSLCPIVLDNERIEAEKQHYRWCVDGGHQLPSSYPSAQSQFNYIIYDFKYYNCCSERGKYIHFYKTI